MPFFRSTEAALLPAVGSDGVRIVHLSTKRVTEVPTGEVGVWADSDLEALAARQPHLVSERLLVARERAPAKERTELDEVVPMPRRNRSLRWCFEGFDLVVLFTTDENEISSVVRVLAPYAGRIWHGIAEGNPLGVIREDVVSRFGFDAVSSVLAELESEGLIERLGLPYPRPGHALSVFVDVTQVETARSLIRWFPLVLQLGKSISGAICVVRAATCPTTQARDCRLILLLASGGRSRAMARRS